MPDSISSHRTSFRLLALLGVFLFSQHRLAAAAAPTAEGLEFFEKKVRPLLAENCYKCHSQGAEKVKGGLLLDTRDGLLKGGETGPGIVPGDPDKSLLIKAVRYASEELRMPPQNKKLSAEQIADLEAWVRMGAPDPRTASAAIASAVTPKDKAKTHWAFQPVRKPALPAVKRREWVQTPLDYFVLAKLEEKGLGPAPRADKRSLIRRASFDLTGLPPTPEEVAAFVADNSEGAFAKVVDRLLASEAYGERWARHWLDISRYADTKGYVFQEERRYPYSYTYRDYVIRAFNEDLPYDQFVREQLAADMLPLGEDKRPLAAMGFLTLGRRFLNNQPDIIDDRIDVVSRGLMGLTVVCARCHDHKFDPIPTKDYYSLYGVFASCSEPAEKPLLGDAAKPKAYPAYLEEKRKREEEQANFKATKEAETLATLRERAGDYLLAALDTKRLADKSKAEGLAKERKLDPGVTQRWLNALENWDRERNAIFVPWFAFAALPDAEFAAKAKEIAAKIREGDILTNPLLAKLFAEKAPASMKEVAETYGKLFKETDKAWVEFAKAEKGKKADSAPNRLPNLDQERVRQVLYAEAAPANLPAGEIPRLFDVPTAEKTRALRRKLEELDAVHPGAPPRAMALQENGSPYNPRVFIRGSPHNQGAEVPRQFLEVVAGEKREPFKNGSGRLELAQSIASPSNPLTARVWVNRVWLHFFGGGLVRTPSDFGLRSDPPSHPELLDYLASSFVENGWSMKKLQRLILLSAAYQQSSDGEPAFAQIDPANQWLWKMNRKRLEFEPTRDTLLRVSGKLSFVSGGQPQDITQAPFSPRRSIYGFVDRQNLPGLFRTFDFASPDTTSAQRFSTTVPQQALFMINSPFVIEQAKNLLNRPEVKRAEAPEAKIEQMYQLALQRSPSSPELAGALKFIDQQGKIPPPPPATPAWVNGFGGFDTNTQRVVHFQPLPHFTGEAWQGGGTLPDDKLGWVTLNAKGGHPGNDLNHAAIRRWTAPKKAVLTISGLIRHETDKGNGIEARVVSSRSGLLGTWVVHNRKQEAKLEKIEVEPGDTIDFVVAINKSLDSNGFTWAPVIKGDVAAATGGATTTMDWDARDEFSGPKELFKPLTAWEKYAQIVLMTNELVFVD